jgi:hypothetical protein
MTIQYLYTELGLYAAYPMLEWGYNICGVFQVGAVIVGKNLQISG